MIERQVVEGSAQGIHFVSVVIPALDEESAIRGCISSAFRARADEVIVVDGGSTDGTPLIARECGATVVQAARGRASQMNAGAALAQGDAFLFLHADCMLSDGAIDRMKGRLNDEKRSVGYFRQKIDGKHFLYRLIELGSNLRAGWLARPYGDQAMFFSREAFEQLGGFPEVALMEDLLIARAARRLGPFLEMREPVLSSPRRWQHDGIVRRILLNWSVALAELMGTPQAKLLDRYEGRTRLCRKTVPPAAVPPFSGWRGDRPAQKPSLHTMPSREAERTACD